MMAYGKINSLELAWGFDLELGDVVDIFMTISVLGFKFPKSYKIPKASMREIIKYTKTYTKCCSLCCELDDYEEIVNISVIKEEE